MPAVFRNPLCRLAVLVCCFSSLGVAAAWAVAGEFGLGLILGEVVFVGAAVLVAVLDKAEQVLDEADRHRVAGHCFLCPVCLCFGPRALGCSACGREIGGAGASARGRTVDCPHCGASLASAPDASCALRNPQIRALCRGCRRMCRADIFHERRVRAIGVPTSPDIAAFCAATPGVAWFRTDRYARADDGTVLTYLIDLARLGTLPSDHAARAIEGVWLHGYAVESLGVGRALDRFLEHARLPERHRERIAVAVAATALADSTGDMLAARFRRVRCGVSAVGVLSGHGFEDLPDVRRQPPEPDGSELRSSRMRVLAALTLAGFETLQGALDPETCAELERGWVYGEIAGGSRYLTHLSNWRVRQDGFGARPALREIEAVWLDSSGMTPLALGEALDQVDRKMSDSRIWREEVRLCIAAPAPGSAIRNVLESRYSRISYGVRPDAFLAFGASSASETSRRA